MATVVVVDDSPSDRQLTETLLHYGGHSVLLCPDAGSALEHIKANQPDLIITDLITPTIDGYELARAVRANASTAATPIIMVTAHYLESEVRRLAAQIGVQKVLIKPYDPQVFLESVATALNEPDNGVRSSRTSAERAFDEEHMRLVSSKLHEKVRDLEVIRLNRSEFLASLSTEMQSHIGALLGCSESLMSDKDLGRDEHRRFEMLKTMNSSARQLMGLVDEIVELSKADAGQNLLRIEDVAVADVVAAVIRALAPLAAKKSVQLHSEAASSGRVQADLYKLTHILADLTVQAIRAAQDGESIAVSARRATGAVEVSVSVERKGGTDVVPERTSKPPIDNLTDFTDHESDVRTELTKRYVELHGGTLSPRGKSGNLWKFSLPLKFNSNPQEKPKLGVRLLRRQQLNRKPAAIGDRDDRFIDPYAIASIVADVKKSSRPALAARNHSG